MWISKTLQTGLDFNLLVWAAQPYYFLSTLLSTFVLVTNSGARRIANFLNFHPTEMQPELPIAIIFSSQKRNDQPYVPAGPAACQVHWKINSIKVIVYVVGPVLKADWFEHSALGHRGERECKSIIFTGLEHSHKRCAV